MHKLEDIIDIGLKHAIKSPMRAKYCAIIVKHNAIVSIGVNDYRLTQVSGKFSTHAEVSAILNCRRRDLKDADMYVVHLNKHEEHPECTTASGKPCDQCKIKLEKCMRKYKLRNVYYTTLM
jgi:deoxycytidylate deaminase